MSAEGARIRRPVLIAGPTASGKSALALALAERDGGLVINADALQVYAGWRILTARPDARDLARAPHRLFGHVAMEAPYSVGRWLREVAALLDAARADGLRPVIVGGTGLYFTALTEGLAPIPAVPAAVRARAEALAASGLDRLVDDLAARDPQTHRSIDLRNPARVMRAWEVLEATGAGLAAWQRGAHAPILPAGDAVRIVLAPAPERLAARIAARLAAMVRDGALDEVRAVMASGWDPRRPSSRALGAAAFASHLRGEIGLEAALARAIVATRRYAKRQRTWARGRMADWDWHDPDPTGSPALLDRIPES